MQIWVALVLVPTNMAALVFWSQPYGPAIAVMAVGGMVPNLFILWRETGFSKAMCLPHLFIWPPLMALICVILVSDHEIMRGYWVYLLLLLCVDGVSLVFDSIDAVKWSRGDRAIAS